MLTSKQIKLLAKGDYPNHRLMHLFPKQQGPGRSSKLIHVEKEDGNGGKMMVPVLQSFFDMTRKAFAGFRQRRQLKQKTSA